MLPQSLAEVPEVNCGTHIYDIFVSLVKQYDACQSEGLQMSLLLA